MKTVVETRCEKNGTVASHLWPQPNHLQRQPVAENHLGKHGTDLLSCESSVDIGIVYSGEQKWLDRLLRSLAESNEVVPFKVVLVCNRHKVELSRMRQRFPFPIDVITNHRAGTYAENFNRVFQTSHADYVLAMNTDMYFSVGEQCISQLVVAMDQHPRCGIGGCRVFRPDGVYAHPARRDPTFDMVAARRLPCWPGGARSLARYLYADRNPGDSFDCDWHSGCFLCVRRAALRQVGGFDCRFRKYFEDVDLCQRMRAQGWSVRHFGASRVWHDEQRASRDWLSRDAWLHLRAYFLWLAKQM